MEITKPTVLKNKSLNSKQVPKLFFFFDTNRNHITSFNKERKSQKNFYDCSSI